MVVFFTGLLLVGGAMIGVVLFAGCAVAGFWGDSDDKEAGDLTVVNLKSGTLGEHYKRHKIRDFLAIATPIFTIASSVAVQNFMKIMVPNTELDFMKFGLCLCSIVFMFAIITFGVRSMIYYNRWFLVMSKKYDDFLSQMYKDDHVKYIEVTNLLTGGKTRNLLIKYPDIYHEMKIPHLWNSYGMTRLIVIFGSLAMSSLIVYTIDLINRL